MDRNCFSAPVCLCHSVKEGIFHDYDSDFVLIFVGETSLDLFNKYIYPNIKDTSEGPRTDQSPAGTINRRAS